MADWKVAPAHTGGDGRIYVSCRECHECAHIGINDSHPTEDCCSDCGWSGTAPEADQCPSCGALGTMVIACPKCSGRYSLLADADLVPQPTSGSTGAYGVPGTSNTPTEN